MKLPLSYKKRKDSLELLEEKNLSDDMGCISLEVISPDLDINRCVYMCEDIYGYYELKDILEAINATLKHFNNTLKVNLILKHGKTDYHAFGVSVDDILNHFDNSVES
jgi:hypothetical protein